MPAAGVARADEPEATPEPSAERAQNRHGGAPRGAVPVARDGPRFANVASRDYARDRIKDTASRRSAIPSLGGEEAEKRKEEPGHECPGNEETEDTNFVGWVERCARNPSNPVPQGLAMGVAVAQPILRREARETRENPGAATRAGTKKTALFDIVNRKGADGVLLTAVDRISGNALVPRPSARLGASLAFR